MREREGQEKIDAVGLDQVLEDGRGHPLCVVDALSDFPTRDVLHDFGLSVVFLGHGTDVAVFLCVCVSFIF